MSRKARLTRPSHSARPAGVLRTLGACLIIAVTTVGCSGVELPFAALSSATSTTINTDKLPTDHLADYITGLDCNSVRQSREGGPFCIEPTLGVIEQPKYCYSSIGGITCYASPDPYRDGRQVVQ